MFGKMHFLLISENEFFHEIKSNGITSFMEFMLYLGSILATESERDQHKNLGDQI